MSIVAAFGDDDHTAADGPYSRVMKVRKWLYIFGACAFLLSFDLYDAEALKSLVRIITLPSWLLIQTVASGVVYLLFQYLLLCAQLWRTYDIVLGERLAYRRADELARAANLAAEARTALEKHRHQAIESTRERANTAHIRLAEANFAAERAMDRYHGFMANDTVANQDGLTGGFSTTMMEAEVNNAHRAVEDAEREVSTTTERYSRLISGEPWQMEDSVSTALYQTEQRADEEFQKLRQQDPATRRGYRDLERAVDLMRIVPPAIFAFLSLISLAHFSF
ncbi:hypothetical protein [Brevundimonas sp. P7753]|uniref:hypothetical protein n=1 Tax=Brevundimonas sp. P7753 TaxID=2726982 RepID=UPI0015B9C742|nr:hypothetical protein [Brevundimonas sp. P7753]NWE54093.1 hypothetical protein [Brevundimonas sp. P7753]